MKVKESAKIEFVMIVEIEIMVVNTAIGKKIVKIEIAFVKKTKITGIKGTEEVVQDQESKIVLNKIKITAKE